jgi:hypothetical protein
MYIYNLGYYSHEESEYIQLYHSDKFTQEQFEEIIMKSVADIIGESKDKDYTFEDIFTDVMEYLIKNVGFKKVKFDADFNIFGWPPILDKNDWKGERGELLDKLADFVKNKTPKNDIGPKS